MKFLLTRFRVHFTLNSPLALATFFGSAERVIEMCMAIYNPDEKDSLEVSFAFERIFLRRDGGSRITADILVKNTGVGAVKRLRCALPYALIDKRTRTRHDSSIRTAEKRFQSLRKNQLEHIKCLNLDFLSPNDDSHWAYRLVRYINIVNQNNPGVFAIKRRGQSVGDEILTGFIKRGWEIGYPPEVENDIWLWHLITITESAVFDIKAPELPREWLQPGESMWLRLFIRVPPLRINRYSCARRLFARQLEYLQVFLSAGAVMDEVRAKLDSFSVPTEINTDVQNRMKAAKLSASDPFPKWLKIIPVNDWRLFIYREFSLIINEPVHRTLAPWRPAMPQIYGLPFLADDSDCRRGPGPKWIHRTLFRGSRTDVCHEFWIGNEIHGAGPGRYITEITSLAPNSVYNYVAWAGLFALILAILNFMRTFLHLI
jgi:hypothetical protein